MSLADDLKKEPVFAGTRCPVYNILGQLDDADRKAFEDAVVKIQKIPADVRRNRNYPYTLTWLLGVLRTNGFRISKESLRRHMLKECNCGTV